MSVAKRDRGKDPEQPVPSNDDEGKAAEDDQQRFLRTNQALKWAKNSISDTKLYLYAKTGQIQESEDSADVIEACAKLDTFREQIESLLLNAENWTKSMLQTWDFQTSFVDALHEGSSVILTFDRNAHDHPPNDSDAQQPAQAQPEPAPPAPAPSDPNSNQNPADADAEQPAESVTLSSSSQTHCHFAQILKGMADELLLEQQASERRYGHASKLLVVPLRNILNHEIMHAVGMKKRYVVTKRQFDNCCTTISNLQAKLKELDAPAQPVAEADKEASAFGKLKLGFGKLIASNPTRDDLEAKLKEAREELPRHMKVFSEARQQLLEAIDIIDQKLNVEVVYYVQQFASFAKQSKSGDITPMRAAEQQLARQRQESASQEEKEAAAVLQAVLPVQEAKEVAQASGVDEAEKRSAFVSEMQMDAMISHPEMANLDTVNLNSPELQQEHQADKEAEVAAEVELGDEVEAVET